MNGKRQLIKLLTINKILLCETSSVCIHVFIHMFMHEFMHVRKHS